MLHLTKVHWIIVEEEDRWEPLYHLEMRKLDFKDIPLKFIDDIKIHITNGATPFGPAYTKTGVKFFRANDIKLFQFDLLNHKYISQKDSNVLKRSILQAEDVVFTIKGKVGIISMVPKNMGDANINQDIALIRLNKKLVDPYYFVALFATTFGNLQIKRFATETINPFLGLGNLKKIKVPISNRSQQKQIATLLKEAESKSIRALEKIRQAQDLFIQALGINLKKIKKENFYKVNYKDLCNLWMPKFYYPLYQNTLKEIKKKFETVKIGEIADISKGDEVGSKNYKRYLEKTDTDVPFIRTSDIVNYEIDNYPDFYISEDIYNELNQNVSVGDILFTNDGKIGLSAMLTEDDKCILQSHIRWLRIKERLSPYYVFAFLTTDFALHQVYRYIVVQATIPTISNNLAKIEIPILPEDRQKEISELVKDAFELKGERKALVKQAKDMVERIIGMEQ